MLRVLEIKQPQIVTVDKRQPQIATVDKRIRKDTFPQHSKSGKVVFRISMYLPSKVVFRISMYLPSEK